MFDCSRHTQYPPMASTVSSRAAVAMLVILNHRGARR